MGFLFILLFLSVYPPLFYLSYHWSDRYFDERSQGLLQTTFLWGVISAVPAGLLEGRLLPPMPDSDFGARFLSVGGWLTIALGIGLIEEAAKVFGVLWARRKGELRERVDGLLFGAAAGAGFACIENIFYVLHGGLVTGVIRALISVPAHVFQGALTGYGLSPRENGVDPAEAAFWFLAAAVLHAVFDGSLFLVPKMSYWLCLVPPCVAAGEFFLVRGLLRDAGAELQARLPQGRARRPEVLVRGVLSRKRLWQACAYFLAAGLILSLRAWLRSAEVNDALADWSFAGAPLVASAFFGWLASERIL